MESREHTEEALDPNLEIVDCHHHLSERFGEPYFLDDLLADTGDGHNVIQTVYIECGWGWDPAAAAPELIPLPEIALVRAVAEESERRGGAVISGIVGHVDLRRGAAAGPAIDLSVEAAGGRLVGIRHAVGWDADIGPHRHEPTLELIRDEAWRAGLAEVGRRGLVFDCLIYHPQLGELDDLARAFPDTSIVIEHLGFPLSFGRFRGHGAEVLDEVATQFERLAAYPNLTLKLGGIGTRAVYAVADLTENPHPDSEEIAARWGPFIRRSIEAFGADRCMFESNFPVDREVASYRVLWNAFKRIAADASPTEKAQLFSGTARRVYGLT